MEGAGTPRISPQGRGVDVWFSGPVAESYPVQATAGVVQILSSD